MRQRPDKEWDGTGLSTRAGPHFLTLKIRHRAIVIRRAGTPTLLDYEPDLWATNGEHAQRRRANMTRTLCESVA